MKTKTTAIKTLAIILTLGLGLSGCFTTGGEKKMMDEAMPTPMETMEKGGMSETMAPPMDTMKKETMETGISDTMK
ncbi:MAG: hypothetical protein KKG47_06670 [Proteobacteria bacterium]|nr:hypothetical protein [Pseudomonadota bacterium]MBU1739743.1 hypothetical protein [Pseudomonadota bacterium]